MARRLRAGFVLAILAALAITSCGGEQIDHGLSVYNPGGGVAGETQGRVKQGVPYTFATGYPLCTKGTPVTITSVSLHQPHGPLHLVDWALWPTYGYEDTVPGSARISPYALGPRITEGCTRKVREVLAVSMKITGPRAYTLGFDVRSDNGSVTVPFAISVCATTTCPKPPSTDGSAPP